MSNRPRAICVWGLLKREIPGKISVWIILFPRKRANSSKFASFSCRVEFVYRYKRQLPTWELGNLFSDLLKRKVALPGGTSTVSIQFVLRPSSMGNYSRNHSLFAWMNVKEASRVIFSFFEHIQRLGSGFCSRSTKLPTILPRCISRSPLAPD